MAGWDVWLGTEWLAGWEWGSWLRTGSLIGNGVVGWLASWQVGKLAKNKYKTGCAYSSLCTVIFNFDTVYYKNYNFACEMAIF